MRKVTIILSALALSLLLVGSGSAVAKPERLDVKQDVTELQAGQSPVLGVVVADLNKARAEMMGLEQASGVVIVRVHPGSPADTAGLKVRDIITAVNNVPMTKVTQLKAELQKAGQQVTLTILRGKETLTISVTPKPMKDWQQVTPPSWLPEMGGIKSGERFDLYLGGQRSFLDKEGQKHTVVATPGTVTEIKDSTLTIMPNGQTAPASFAVTDKTVIRMTGGKLSSLKAGDKIIVVTVDNPQEARLIISSAKMGRGQWSMPKGRGFGGGQMGRGQWLMPRGRGFGSAQMGRGQWSMPKGRGFGGAQMGRGQLPMPSGHRNYPQRGI